MRSLTNEEERVLSESIPDDALCIHCATEENYSDWPIVKRMVVRGLLVKQAGTCVVCGEPDEDGSFYATRLGRLALELHLVSKKLTA